MTLQKMAASHARLVASDIWKALLTNRTAQLMAVLLVVSLVCWDMPYASAVLYPFKLFVTTIHEACHALAARLTGGNVGMISIAPDESGLTLSMGGFRPLVTMAGYLGTALFGGLLIWWGRSPGSARFVLQSIGTTIIALTVFYGGGGFFSFLSMLVIGLCVLFVSRKGSDTVCHFFLLLLAVQTTLSAVFDIKTLFLVSVASDAHSDAKTMEQLTFVPAVVWSVLWGVIAVAILIFAFWLSYRPARQAADSTPADAGKPADPA